MKESLGDNQFRIEKVSKESLQEQNKKIWNFYLEYLAKEGYSAMLESNASVAKETSGLVVEQQYNKGDYPYGMDNRISLVVSK